MQSKDIVSLFPLCCTMVTVFV